MLHNDVIRKLLRDKILTLCNKGHLTDEETEIFLAAIENVKDIELLYLLFASIYALWEAKVVSSMYEVQLFNIRAMIRDLLKNFMKPREQ